MSKMIDIEDDRSQTPHRGERRTSSKTHTPVSKAKFTHFMRALFVFQLSTQAYVTLRHLIPWFLEDSDPVSVLFPQLVILYLFVVAFLNWACIIRYSSEYTGPTDRHDKMLNGFAEKVSQRFEDTGPFLRDSRHVKVDVTEKGGLPWGYCQRCEMDIPPRTVHCRFCRVCVLRRDHHCHLVGCCIGHWNQRFFAAMAANGMVLGCLGAFLTLGFLYDHHSSGETLWNYFLPVTVFKWLWGDVSGLQAILTFHAYMLCSFGPISSHYFAVQTCLIASGRTKREVKRKMKMMVTSSVCANLRQVFGYCWWLGLFLPLPHLYFPQTHQGLSYDNVKMMPD